MASLHPATATPPPRHSLSASLRASSLSWSASIAVSRIPPPPRLELPAPAPAHGPGSRQSLVVRAAWTRRSRGEAEQRPNRKSWKQRTDMYMRPFLLNVFFSKRFVHAKVMHRGTSKVIAVATTNAKDLRLTLPTLVNDNACRTIGRLIAERSMKNERIEGKLGIIIDTIKEHGIIFV
ncbi:uncharacterized protein LOC120656856 isoform X2 [Panicum virgatum]|uniref:50S ribosomal protein L18 n=1 Tax=Panicum virgatum TaxID=38727 RepID=A0A8T0X704_PANVG|nr:uncharacterized protein LOC120656856 isoform X2 [Panicum virgatum]KAG2653134.1 hypothetical protein PVAP13_1NG431700 [Panicum virgatum]